MGKVIDFTKEKALREIAEHYDLDLEALKRENVEVNCIDLDPSDVGIQLEIEDEILQMQVIDDFKCSECGSEREIFHSNEAGEEYFCECGGRMVKQFAASQNFRFYGQGTYVQHTKGD